MESDDVVRPDDVREMSVAAWVTRDWSDLIGTLAARDQCSKSAIVRVALRKHLRDEGLLAA